MFDLKKGHCAFYWIQMVLESDFHQGEERGKSIDRYIAAAGHFRDAEGWAITNKFEYHKVKTKAEFDKITTRLVSNSENPILIEVCTTDLNESEAMSCISKANDNRSLSEKISNKLKYKVKKLF